MKQWPPWAKHHLHGKKFVNRTSIRMKIRYWPVIMFTLNASMNNAYQLYRLTPSGSTKGFLYYLKFIRNVVQTYMNMHSEQRSTAGRTPKTGRKKHHIITSNDTQVRCGQYPKNTTKNCKKYRVGCHVNGFTNK